MSQQNSLVAKKSSRTSEQVCQWTALLLLLLIVQIVIFKISGAFSGEFFAANLAVIPAILGVVFCKLGIFELDTKIAKLASVTTYFVSLPPLPELVSQTPLPHYRPPVASAF